MARYDGRTFRSQRIVLDGNEYIGCTFTECEIVFRAASPVTLDGVTFSRCRWTLDGAAALTVGFLSALYRAGVTELIEQTFENIRRGGQPRQEGRPEA